ASQDSRYLLGLHRPADQESLREVALAILEKLELRDSFHALGRDFYIKPTGHGDRGAYDTLVTVVLDDILDQRLVEDETVDDSGVERAEGNILRAEVIERKPHSQFAQALKGFELGGPRAHKIAIADFQLDASCVQRSIHKRSRYRLHQPAVQKLLRRQVYRHREIRQLVLVLPRCELSAGGVDHPFTGGVDQSAAFENRQEPGRR